MRSCARTAAALVLTTNPQPERAIAALDSSHPLGRFEHTEIITS